MKKFEDRQIRLFISSTFGGMNNDRKALVDHVFPEIHRRCSERGIGFTEVDLRWGITTEEVDKGLAVPICFQQMDNCQPFFIGLLGEYYGSTIRHDQTKTACADYPWIESGESAKKGLDKQQLSYLDRSITELEMTYGLFNVGQNRSDEQRISFAKHALFYFRDPHYAETLPINERQPYIEPSADNRAKQQYLKQRLRDHGCQITEYQKPIDLKKLVLEPLWAKISEKFPDTLTPQQRGDFEHEAFAASRQRVYIKRQADFDRLSRHANSDEPPLIIVGESGSGKTALFANWAAEYMDSHADDLVFWHFCGCSPDSSDPFGLIRRIMLNLKSHFKMEDEIPGMADAMMAKFGDWLAKAPGRVILIIDGLNQLEDSPISRGWLYSIPAKTCLFLSVISADDERLSADWQRHNLPLLTEISAREDLVTEYLSQYGKTLAAKPMQALLVHPKTANPLYLQVILEELRIFGDFDKLESHLDGYLQAETIPALYEKVLGRLEADFQPEGFPHLVEDALCLLWAARHGLEELELLAILDIPQAIWSPLFLALQNALVSRAGLLSFFHDYLRQAVRSRYLSNGEIQQRWHLRLADFFEKQEIDARVANELPWQLQQAGENERLRSCISDIRMFLQFVDNKYYELWGYWLGLEPEKTMVGAYGDSFAEYEKNKKHTERHLGYVLNQLGCFFEKVGYFLAAIPLLRRALAITEKVLGKEHPDTAFSLNNLALLLESKGDYDSAEPLYKRALAIKEKVLGKEHPNTAISLNNLAELLRAKGDYDSAEPLYKRALAITEKVLGKEHPNTASSLNNLALLLESKGDYDSAEPLFKRALAISEKILGKEHPNTASSLNNLAELLRAKGDYDSAEPLYKRALAIREKVLGKEHPNTATCLDNLAGLLTAKGDYDSAEPLLKRALAITEKVLGKEHPNTATSLNNLAELLRAKGDYDSAEPLCKRALAIREKVLGKEHPNTATSLNNLAGLLRAKGDYDSAEPLYKRALAITEKVLGKEHPNTMVSLGNLAGLLGAKGDYDSAEPLYKRALAISEKVLGKVHPDTATSLNNLAGLLESKGDYDLAEPLYKRALAIREKVLGKEHPNTASSLNNLAGLLRAKGDYDSAEPLYKRALAITEKVLGKVHPDTATSLDNLAGLLTAKGDYDSAEPLFKRALAIKEKVLGKEHPDTATSLNNLAGLHCGKEDYDSAEQFFKRALTICENVLGAKHPNTIKARKNLKQCHFEYKRHKKTKMKKIQPKRKR